MATDARLDSERLFHDQQAAERQQRFRDLAALRFTDEWYLNHEPWIRPAFSLLGDLRGRHILDYGCGHGMASVVMARRGAKVKGIDLSAVYIAEANRRALANDVAIHFSAANAEALPFADAQFDLVWGNAILHHLDLPTACAELKRVLKPGGKAVFCEPWGGNLLIEFARRYLPYAGKHRTVDEQPLRSWQLAAIKREFPTMQWHGYQLFGGLRRFWKRESATGTPLDRLDDWLLGHVPILQKWGRYVVLTMRNE